MPPLRSQSPGRAAARRAVAVLGLFGALAAAGGASPEEAEAAYQGALRMKREGVYPAAVDLLYKAVSLRPQARYYLALGYALKDVEQPRLAYRAFRDAYRMGAARGDDAYGLLTLLVGMSQDHGFLEDTPGYLEKLAEVDPKGSKPARRKFLLLRADAAQDAARYSEAARHFAALLRLSPDSIAGQVGVSRALRDLAEQTAAEGRHDASLGALLRLHRYAPSPEVATEIAAAFEKAGSPRRHRHAVRRILRKSAEKNATNNRR